MPDHVAMILDGNRRWARARGLEPWQGHYYGFKAVEKLADASRKLGVHTFTVWAFSTENWDRPQIEIDAIMNIFRRALKEKEKEFHRGRVALVHLGRKDRLPPDIRRELTRIESETAKYIGHNVFNLAVDYGGRDEIVRATQKIIDSGLKIIDDKTFESFLDTANQPYPNPDLFIRTSGEQRTSGLLPWQMVYSEFYFETEHLPDFTPEKLMEAILDYSRRRRRFGGNDTVEHFHFDPKVTAKLEIQWWRLRNIPEGIDFKDYAMKHIKEQFGLSTILALQAAGFLMEAVIEEKKSKFDKAAVTMKKFYELVRDELKLAFEPKIVAFLEVELDRELGGKESVEGTFEAEETAKRFYAEVYRISLFQAAKAAHLRVLAAVERNMAEAAHSTGSGSSRFAEEHWDKAEVYLQKFYSALKERVA